MRRLLKTALISSSIALASPAIAKQTNGCEAVLALTRQTIEAQKIHPLPAYDTTFVVLSGTEHLRSLVGAEIRRLVGLRVSTAAFMGHDVLAGDDFYAKALHDPEELTEKSKLAAFETAEFVLIDNLEAFVLDFNGRPNVQNLDRLRHSLRKRIGTRRSTVIMVNDPANVDRWLSGLK